eukprot:jgi/Psemu1/49095/gm1.49095_g
MIEVDNNDSSFDCLIDNVCKVIVPKVLKANDNGCFDTPEQLVTGILELSGLDDKHNNETCVTRFLQYDVNSQQEVHQQIFMEHITYVFCEIFVIDPHVNEQVGTIFTPLIEKLAGYLLERSDDILSANILVEFLDNNVVNNYGKGTGELNPEFKHLQGCDFVFHKRSDFETWDCFKTSIGDIKKFNESQNGYQSGFIPPWVVEDRSQNNTNHPHTGTNKERGSPDTGASLTNYLNHQELTNLRGIQTMLSQNGDKAKVSNVSLTD